VKHILTALFSALLLQATSADAPVARAKKQMKASFIASSAVMGESLILRSTTHRKWQQMPN
jgi:hypothetical protein